MVRSKGVPPDCPDYPLEAAARHCIFAETAQLQLFDTGPEGIDYLVEFFSGRPLATNLLTISIGVSTDCIIARPIGDRGASRLGLVLKRCPSLKVLALQRHGIGDAGARALSTAFADCPSLQMVDLRGNCVSVLGARALVHGCRPHGGMQLRGIAIPLDALPMWLVTGSAELLLHHVSDSDMLQLAERLRSSDTSHITSVQINGEHRRLGPSGFLVLEKMFRVSCRSLQRLSLRGHRFTAEAVKLLSGMLRHLHELRTLDLSDNNIGVDSKEGAGVLCLLVGESPKLEALDVRDNDFDSSLTDSLLSFLIDSHNTSLRELHGVELSGGMDKKMLMGRYRELGTLRGESNTEILACIRNRAHIE